MEYTLIVTTETLVSVSDDVITKVNKAKSAFDQMSAVILQMSNHWESSAQQTAQQYYNIRKDDYERIFSALAEHIDNLKTIAGAYETGEQKNTGMFNMLSADAIR